MSRPLPVATVVRGLGEVLITLGLVVLLFCYYELAFTGYYAGQQQDRLVKQFAVAPEPVPLTTAAPAAAVAPPLGNALAQIFLPRLGRDFHFIVVEGVGTEMLKQGPGHLPGSALPGGLGNTVISGHRTTYLAPFNRLDELQPGDAVVLETRAAWFTYTVTGDQVVHPTAVEVTFPVPGRPDATPTEHLLTLTTCNPKYSASTRLIVRGILAETLPKSSGRRPAALG